MEVQPSVAVGWPMLLWIVIVTLTAWELVWKAIALWFAARRNQLVWYVALVIFNTVGILPIIYIFLIAPRRPELVAAPHAPAAEA